MDTFRVLKRQAGGQVSASLRSGRKSMPSGGFAGVIEGFPFFMELGINCVELLPVFEFDEQENRRTWEGRRGQERKLVLGPRSLAVLISAKAK